MNALATIDPPARARRGKAATTAATPSPKPAAAPIAAAIVVPSSPRLVPLRLLRRAPENVRHTRVDEDVAGLADDIVAHGLLQGLIGYEDGELVQIVGGGRRFQALRRIENDGLIDGDFPVPVLIRDVEEAIELSLAENLQQRTMSPVDEFLAFRALMDNGTNSPGSLAKRFGFSERVVRQRLRLAELAPPILDALAGREITIDAAMAYAGSQDQKLQAEIFKVEGKKNWQSHEPRNIKWALAQKGIRADNPLFLFVGEDSYASRGGTFEDDLFNEETGKERALANPGLLLGAARDMIEFQMLRLLPELQARADLSPTIAGYVIASDLRVKSYGNISPKPPAGFVLVEKYDHAPMWKTIRNNKIAVHVIVGINDKGELIVNPKIAFVPKAQKDAVAPPQQGYVHREETPLERAVRERNEGVALWSKRLAVGPFTGTPLEGRAFWPDGWDGRPTATVRDGVAGHLVPVRVFVSDKEVAEQLAAAEERYDVEHARKVEAEQAEVEKKKADEVRYQELIALDPPAIVVVDGEAWARENLEDEPYDEAQYTPIDELSDAAGATSWHNLVADFRWSLDDIGHTFATRDAYDDAMAAAGADEVTA